MTRRVHDLTVANLDDLPAACRACVFWEVRGAPRGPVPGQEQAGRAGKEAWWQATQLEWGSPGKAVYVDDVLAGYATFAPAAHFPQVRRLGHAVSDDALLLAAVWVRADQRTTGLAKVLLQSALRETHKRGGKALEAFGGRAGEAVGTCLVPEGFLLANGFELLHEHHSHPLLRLDLRQTVRWQESVGHALEGVLSALARRERAPAPSRPALESRPVR